MMALSSIMERSGRARVRSKYSVRQNGGGGNRKAGSTSRAASLLRGHRHRRRRWVRCRRVRRALAAGEQRVGGRDDEGGKEGPDQEAADDPPADGLPALGARTGGD